MLFSVYPKDSIWLLLYPRSFYTFVKNSNHKNSSIPNNLNLDGNISKDMQSNVDLFTEFFGSVYTNYDYLYNQRSFDISNYNIPQIFYDDILLILWRQLVVVGLMVSHLYLKICIKDFRVSWIFSYISYRSYKVRIGN